ncbi:hypothetical protein ASPCAL07290 [Aspergillus calidoustus]|uniref:Uncharacterized protein n=1 Tax=Aspergillus calidoustus TaxID=454130 RepID=A0A0U5G4U8_ASPCI|nr:hypothetical protein ASPCAL07290 [Aspergillus calidoustus]
MVPRKMLKLHLIPNSAKGRNIGIPMSSSRLRRKATRDILLHSIGAASLPTKRATPDLPSVSLFLMVGKLPNFLCKMSNSPVPRPEASPQNGKGLKDILLVLHVVEYWITVCTHLAMACLSW